MNYNEYLNSSHWMKLRASALQRWGARCLFDPLHQGNIHVHHIEYKPNLEDCDEYDLVPLCEDCHKDIHKNPRHLAQLKELLQWSRSLRHGKCTLKPKKLPPQKARKITKVMIGKQASQRAYLRAQADRKAIKSALAGKTTFNITERHFKALKTRGVGVSRCVLDFLGTNTAVSRIRFKNEYSGQKFLVWKYLKCLSQVERHESEN